MEDILKGVDPQGFVLYRYSRSICQRSSLPWITNTFHFDIDIWYWRKHGRWGLCNFDMIFDTLLSWKNDYTTNQVNKFKSVSIQINTVDGNPLHAHGCSVKSPNGIGNEFVSVVVDLLFVTVGCVYSRWWSTVTDGRCRQIHSAREFLEHLIFAVTHKEEYWRVAIHNPLTIAVLMREMSRLFGTFILNAWRATSLWIVYVKEWAFGFWRTWKKE